MKCAVINCRNARTASDKNQQLCFFKFPKNADLAKRWLSFCGTKDAAIMKNGSVCMKHFKDEDIVGALQFELGLAKRRKLRPGAVPCLNRENENEYQDPLTDDENQYQSLTHLNKCRTCYRDFELDSNAEDPFDNDNSVLLFRIEVICGVWLSNIEGGPRYMCPDCQMSLKNAIEFREKVISTELMLTKDIPVCVKPEVKMELVGIETGQGISEPDIRLNDDDDDEDTRHEDIFDESYSPNTVEDIEILEPSEENVDAAPADPLSVARGAKILNELISEFTGKDKAQTEKAKKETKVEKPDKQQAQERKAEILSRRQANPKSKAERNRMRRARLKNKPPEHVCDQCGQIFRMVHNLQIHMLRHTRTKNFQCPECPMTFYDAYMRNMHIRVRHKGELPFVCKYCPERFAYAAKRQKHEANVHGAAPRLEVKRINPEPMPRPQTRYYCKLCDKNYVSKFSFTLHLKSHGEAHAFNCQKCDKSYTDPAKLKRHEKIHGERPLQCDVCLKGFYQSTRLNSHKLIHTGERPFWCELCNVNFRYKTNLKAHANTKMHQENLLKTGKNPKSDTD